MVYVMEMEVMLQVLLIQHLGLVVLVRLTFMPNVLVV